MQAYLALPVLLGMWFVAWLWKRTTPLRASEIDLDVCFSLLLSIIVCSSDIDAYRPDVRVGSPWKKCGYIEQDGKLHHFGRVPTASSSAIKSKVVLAWNQVFRLQEYCFLCF